MIFNTFHASSFGDCGLEGVDGECSTGVIGHRASGACTPIKVARRLPTTKRKTIISINLEATMGSQTRAPIENDSPEKLDQL
jgi:hypothetical protein